jgi:hypothetical protein
MKLISKTEHAPSVKRPFGEEAVTVKARKIVKLNIPLSPTSIKILSDVLKKGA